MLQTGQCTLVASPYLPFGELCGRLAKLGWDLESASEKPMLAGEPEVAMFVQDRTSIHYTFNPVVGFRVLQFRGPDPKPPYMQVSGAIPVLDQKDICKLLASTEIKQLLLGLFAAEELSAIEAFEQVAGLSDHPDTRISRTAIRVRDSLLTEIVGLEANHLIAEQDRHPERLIWFEHLSQPELRRQVLRWFMRDSTVSNKSIDQTLRSALADPDPEVRITAVIAAAKLNAKSVGPALRDAAIPISTREGADPRDRFFFERLRQTALRYLAMESAVPNDSSNAGKHEEFRRAIQGELEVQDDPTLLMHALITPLKPAEPPKIPPEGVEHQDGRYFLKRSGLKLCRVDPIPHWLGEGATSSPSGQNPIRRVMPQNRFYTAEIPLTTSMVFWSSKPDSEPPPVGRQRDFSPHLCSHEEAIHLCEVFSSLEGVRLHLPSADQWEMAVRGPDGRRYPWGNCLCRDGQFSASPWGVKKAGENVFEWTSDIDPSGSRILVGGQAAAPCAARRAVSAGAAPARCGLRFVLEEESV